MSPDPRNDRAHALMAVLVRHSVQPQVDDEPAWQASQEVVDDADLWVRTCAALAVNTDKVLAARGLSIADLGSYARLGASIADEGQEAVLLRSLSVLEAFAEQDERVDDILGEEGATSLGRFALLGGLVNLAGDAYKIPT